MNQPCYDQQPARPRAGREVCTRMSAVGLGGRGPRILPTRRRQPSSTAGFSVAAFQTVVAFLQKRSARAAALGAGLLCPIALGVAPPAWANVDLAVGMPINIGNHGCSVGFFGFDAVTID